MSGASLPLSVYLSSSRFEITLSSRFKKKKSLVGVVQTQSLQAAGSAKQCCLMSLFSTAQILTQSLLY